MAVAPHPEVAALFARALEEAILLVERGWTQGAYYRYENGKLRRVDLAYAVECGARAWGLSEEELRGVVRAQLDEPYRSDEDYGLEHWNDQLWRTRSEVLLLLNRTREAL